MRRISLAAATLLLTTAFAIPASAQLRGRQIVRNDCDGQVERLQRLVRKLRVQNGRLKRANRALKSELGICNGVKARLVAENRRLQAGLRECTAGAERCHGALREATANLGTCREELQQGARHLRMCRGELGEATAHLRACRAGWGECREELGAAIGHARECREELGACQRRAGACGEQLGECREHFAGCERRVEHLGGELRECVGHVEECREGFGRCRGALETSEARLNRCTGALEDCGGNLGECRRALASCEGGNNECREGEHYDDELEACCPDAIWIADCLCEPGTILHTWDETDDAGCLLGHACGCERHPCNDGSPLRCDAEPPRCERGTSPAIVDGCWVCASPDRCVDRPDVRPVDAADGAR